MAKDTKPVKGASDSKDTASTKPAKSAKSAKTAKAAAKLTVREKIQQLDQLYDWFMGDEFALDQATEYYAEAMQLVKDIEQDLENLKNDIEVIDRKFDGIQD